MPWGWIFAQIIGDKRSTKGAKIIVVHWCLIFLRWGQVCFPMHLYGHHTFVWEKCWEFQTTSSLKPLGQCSSNFMWSLLRLGERKLAKMVEVHWPSWPPCPYMVKTFKNLLLQNRGPFYGEVKFASLCICMGTIHLYGKMLRISNDFSSEASGPMCSNFMWSLLRLWEQKIAKMVAVHWPRWLPCPYMVKTFKDLLLQNQISPEALSLHKSSGTGDLPKLLKCWSYIDVWPFYCKVKFASPCICIGPIHLYGKNVENSYFRHLLYNPVESKLDDQH